ncbi:unnamed protein product [Symbiodinium natans]|uniref:Uncharacterized protein n=1 Tax=Symbiodinium natans TaxID=878477 RepID=A0A812V0S4_9DINO|nr:unnamed protein product [Symbiodinium natans]
MGKRAFNEKGAKKGDKTPQAFVKKFEYFGKAKLAPYCNEEGVPFYLDKGEDEKDFLRLANIRKSRNSSNEELCCRLGMGLCLDAATADAGAKLISKHFGGEWTEEVRKSLTKTGLPGLRDIFSSEEGKRFKEAVAILNVGKDKQPSERDVNRSIKHFVGFLTDSPDELHKHLARLASATGVLYLFAMTVLKDMALLGDPAAWAKLIEGKQGKDVAAWMKKPKDREKLRQAVSAELMAKVKNNDKARGKKRRVSDSSEDEKKDSDTEESKSSGESASASSASVSSCKKRRAEEERKRAKKESKKLKASASAEMAREQRTAAFTAWPQGQVEVLGCDIANEKTQIGNLAGGQAEHARLQAFLDREMADQVSEDGKIPNVLAKKALVRLGAIAAEVEAFWEEQSGGATAAASAL